MLSGLVERVRAEPRLQDYAAAFPERARVSESILPLVLAALQLELGRGLVVLLPEDADARDAAEAAGWFLGEEAVALFPSRGVHYGSGLEPPPHLVGERARALEILDRGGLVCASAAAVAEGLPPVALRPAPLRVVRGDEPGLDALAEHLASAGYERVERVEERGQFAVRGGLVDVFGTTGREPLRIELFGDEVEQIRVFSPFTQRALRQIDEAVVYPAAERRRELVEVDLGPEDGVDAPAPVPGDLVPGSIPARHRLGAGRGADGLGRRRPEADRPRRRGRAGTAAPGPAVQLRRAAPRAGRARSVGGRERARRPAAPGARRRRDVPAPGRGAAPAAAAPARLDVDARAGDGPAGLTFAVSPARRGFVWRDLGIALLPDTQVFRKRPSRTAAAPGRALQSFSDLRTRDYVVHEDHGVAQLLGFETKEVAGVTRDYLLLAFRGDDRVYVPHEQIGKVSRYIGADARAPALSKLGGKAWDNLKSRAREHLRELAGDLLQLYAQRQTQPGVAYDVEHEWVEQLEAEFPYRETEDQRAAIEAVKEDLEAPHPMDRLVCGDVGFGKTEVALRAAFAVAVAGKQVLMLVPTTVLAQQHWNTFRERYRDYPVRVEMVSRFRKPADVSRCSPSSPRARSTS